MCILGRGTRRLLQGPTRSAGQWCSVRRPLPPPEVNHGVFTLLLAPLAGQAQPGLSLAVWAKSLCPTAEEQLKAVALARHSSDVQGRPSQRGVSVQIRTCEKPDTVECDRA